MRAPIGAADGAVGSCVDRYRWSRPLSVGVGAGEATAAASTLAEAAREADGNGRGGRAASADGAAHSSEWPTMAARVDADASPNHDRVEECVCHVFRLKGAPSCELVCLTARALYGRSASSGKGVVAINIIRSVSRRVRESLLTFSDRHRERDL